MSASLESFVQTRRTAVWALAERCAARLAGMPLPQLMLDANRWANEVLAVERLLDCDAVVFGGCDALAVEAAGVAVDWSAQRWAMVTPVEMPADAPGAERWRNLLAAVARVSAQRPPVATFVLLPGPARFCRMVLGRIDEQTLRIAKPILSRLVEQVCDARPTAVLLREGLAGADAAVTDSVLRNLSTLRNITRHFDVPLGLAVSDLSEQTRLIISKSRSELALWLGDGLTPPPAIGDLLDAFATVEIGGIALDVTDEREQRTAELRDALILPDADRWFLNAHAEVDETADLARIRARVPQWRAATAVEV